MKIKLLMLALIGACWLTVGGCSCEESVDSVDKTADDLTGGSAVKQGNELKDDLRQINKDKKQSIKDIQE